MNENARSALIRNHLEQDGPVKTSAPCRLDMGGTLDIKTLYLPLIRLSPCTFNLAINLRTVVTVSPHTPGMIKVSSRGFKSVEFPFDQAPFDHPLGLMFAIAVFFNADGVHIDIHSTSPPRSALGGSSAAAVALIAALTSVLKPASGSRLSLSPDDIALTGHALEESVARVPCGLQDQLAAAYGGVHAWHWRPTTANMGGFERQRVLTSDQYEEFETCFLAAYCGLPHESKDINGRWIKHFLSGQDREIWRSIAHCTNMFVEALVSNDIEEAVAMMSAEVKGRRFMTPDVFDDMGKKLLSAANDNDCAARFTGAGGGGCVWALGLPGKIASLKDQWQKLLATNKQAHLLDAGIDDEGVRRH